MSESPLIRRDIRSLLGLRPSSDPLTNYISALYSFIGASNAPSPEIKSYPDAVYFNYFPIGFSLLFVPQKGYKPTTGLKHNELKDELLSLDSIDIYNPLKPKPSQERSKSAPSRNSELIFSQFPVSPIVLSLALDVNDKDGKVISRPAAFEVTPSSTGKEFVQSLGEPDRKGGGAGPSSGSIGIWCEWTKDGVMVEFGGEEAKGPQAWERGKDAVWKVITLFVPK
ncbi:hypothetical protein BDQ17DRAFT_1386242 [Cyathus striatus]|nr:hypothetical protein BDQ17DRAFT_1386242 [Cyathus striatus]